MNEGTGMWKRQETKRPNSLQIPEAKRPRNQEDKSHKTCNNNAKKAKTTKSAADQESKIKKIGKLPFRNMCIYAHSLGSLGCYLQAVPFFWHDLNLTACTDLRWNLPFPPPGPQICLEDVCCNVSTLLIALIWKMLEKKSAVQTDRHMLVAQTDASIFPKGHDMIKPLFTCSPNAPVVW